MEKVVDNKLFKYCFWIILSAIFMIGYPLSPFFEQFPFHDSGVYITESEMIRNGSVIYRDFFEQKGPLLYLFEVLGLSIGGLTAIWLLCSMWGAFVASVTEKICYVFCNNRIAVFFASTITMLMTIRFGGNNTAELIITPVLLLSFYFLTKSICNQKMPSFLHSLIIGCSLSIIIFVKANIAGGLLFLLFLLFVYSIWTKQFKEFVVSVVGILVGVILIVVPVVVYFVYNNALTNFIDTYFLFNYKFASHSSDPISITERLTVFVKLVFLKPVCIFGWCFVVVSYFVDKTKKQLNIFWLCFSVLMVEAISVAFISGRDHFYYITPILPLYAFFIASCLSANGLFRKASIAGLVLLFAYLGAKSVREIMVRPDTYKEELNLCTYIKENSSKEDKVIFYNAPVGCYYSCDKICPSKYPYVVPNGFLREEIIEDYLSIEPLFIVIKEGKNFPVEMLMSYERIDYPSKVYSVYKFLK